MTRKNGLLHILRELRLRQCCYSMGTQSPTCDCKFTSGDILGSEESGNGCPELLVLIRFIEQMTPELAEVLFSPTADLSNVQFAQIQQVKLSNN